MKVSIGSTRVQGALGGALAVSQRRLLISRRWGRISAYTQVQRNMMSSGVSLLSAQARLKSASDSCCDSRNKERYNSFKRLHNLPLPVIGGSPSQWRLYLD
jgi:hypothetical protein